MKKYPPREPYKPSKPERKNYINYKTRELIYSDMDIIMEDFDLEENDIEFSEPEKRISEMSLLDIIKLAPPGADPADIYLNIDWPRNVDYINYSYYYSPRDTELEESRFSADMKRYDEEMVKYQVELAKYQVEKDSYDDHVRQEKIKELEASLNALKNK